MAKAKRGANPKRLPKIRRLEAIAQESGFEPGRISLLFFGENQSRLLRWYEELKAGVVPAELAGKSKGSRNGIQEGWDTFYREAADFMDTEERWMEYFHGKKQRIETTGTLDTTVRKVGEAPLTEDEWQRKYGERNR